MEIRIYDLGDLFAIAPPYPAQERSDLVSNGFSSLMFPNMVGQPQATMQGGFGGMGGMGGMGGGFFSVPDHRQTLQSPPANRRVLHQLGEGSSAGQSSMDDLVNVIKVTIAPELWTEENGGSIAKLGNALIISADADTHEQIDAMLNLFRKRWGTVRTVSLEAYWLWMTEAELAPAMAEAPAQPTKGGDLKTFGLIKADAWKTILEDRRKPESKHRAGWRAKITCYNGQTVHTVSGTQRLAVVQVRPVMSRGDDNKPEGRIAYQPEVHLIQEGAALQVTPIAGVSGETVLLDIHSRVSLPEEQKPAPPQPVVGQFRAEGGPAEIVDVIDRERLLVQRFSTTLRVPVGEPMLVGGMTFSSRPLPGEPNLYLFIKTAVQELRAENSNPHQAPPTKTKNPPPPRKNRPRTSSRGSGREDRRWRFHCLSARRHNWQLVASAFAELSAGAFGTLQLIAANADFSHKLHWFFAQPGIFFEDWHLIFPQVPQYLRINTTLRARVEQRIFPNFHNSLSLAICSARFRHVASTIPADVFCQGELSPLAGEPLGSHGGRGIGKARPPSPRPAGVSQRSFGRREIFVGAGIASPPARQTPQGQMGQPHRQRLGRRVRRACPKSDPRRVPKEIPLAGTSDLRRCYGSFRPQGIPAAVVGRD